MTILILKRVPTSLRGDLSRWLLEVGTGVFVGKVSGLVRDKLWEKCQTHCKGGSGVLIKATKSEQGFAILHFGDDRWVPRDFEGITLVTKKSR